MGVPCTPNGRAGSVLAGVLEVLLRDLQNRSSF
jgi:hypothetical protein